MSVSTSGGKDSSVLFDLVYHEALKRGQPFNAFFLDQEAEYRSTIDIIEYQMRRPGVRPFWYQVACRMTNATSYKEEWLYAFDPSKEEEWIHPHVDISLKDRLPVDRFYRIMEYVDDSWGPNSASLVGLRSEESLNRYGAVTRNSAIPGIPWSSKCKGETVKLYPIYDWTFEDIFTYLGNEDVPYNRVYDWLYTKGVRVKEMRVSNLIHEKAFRSLALLQEFEPNTYERMVRRLVGVRTAALYGKESMLFDTRKLPPRYTSWKEYRDFLLSTFTGERQGRFVSRFAGHQKDERIYRQQVRQLLLNDWEDNVPVKKVVEQENPLKKWMDIL